MFPHFSPMLVFFSSLSFPSARVSSPPREAQVDNIDPPSKLGFAILFYFLTKCLI